MNEVIFPILILIKHEQVLPELIAAPDVKDQQLSMNYMLGFTYKKYINTLYKIQLRTYYVQRRNLQVAKKRDMKYSEC